MTTIIGYGNIQRGEDGFGVEVINRLQNIGLSDVHLISCFQLTPELCLELLDCKKVIFIDASYCNNSHYTLSCPLLNTKTQNLSHHISPLVLVSLLKDVYKKELAFEIFSMATNNFTHIKNFKEYNKCIEKTVNFLCKN